MSTPVALANAVSIRQGSGDRAVTLVDNLSFDVFPKEIVAVVGESGAGKTLATKSLLGIVPPGLHAEGTVEIAGHVTDLSTVHHGCRDRQLAKLGSVVMQDPASMFDPLQRIGRQLLEAPLYHRLMTKDEASSLADTLLESVGFTEPNVIKRLYPHQLSGGMAQRAAIAMSLMTQPALLVVDEPTSALDANIRLEVMTLIASTATAAGTGVVLVTHDLPLAARFATKVVVLHSGRIVETGTAEAVMRRPEHSYTKSLLSSAVTLQSKNRVRLPAPQHEPYEAPDVQSDELSEDGAK